MSKMLFLARGGGLMFSHVTGQSIFADLPFEVHVLVDKRSACHFNNVGDHVHVEIARWSDLQAIRERVAALHQQYPFFALLTLNEQLMELAAELREALNINGVGSAQTSRFRDKVEMKRCLSGSSLRVPHYAECTDPEAVYALQEQFNKVVIKPRNSTGSKGVAMINEPQELRAWFDKAVSPGDFEAEEYIAGDLYHINALVLDGQAVISATALYLPGKSTLEFIHGAPLETVMLTDGKLKTRMEEASNTVIQKLGLRQGITHLECFLTPDHEIVFCEVAARPGGGGLIWMIEQQYGVNFSRAAILIEAGMNDLAIAGQQVHPGVVGLQAFRPGSQMAIVKQVPGPSDLSADWINLANIFVEPGNTVMPSSHSTDYLGVCVISAIDQADFIEKCNLLNTWFYQHYVIETF